MTLDNFLRNLRVALVIPTCNAARHWPALARSIGAQRFAPQRTLVVDSSSTDGTATLAREAGFELLIIDRHDFNHGATRQLGAACVPEAEILIYLTQDAFPSGPEAFANLLAVFEDPQVGAAYGRQLPRPDAGPIEAHARLFNYPPVTRICSDEDRKALGFKAAFASNSFAAYRRTALDQVGGFPAGTVLAEDSMVFARMLLAGWKTAYVADACVIHSHNYSVREEFSRYFDIGAFHARECWIEREFRGPYGEGRRFVISEMRYLAPRHLHLIPLCLLRTAAKYLGYRLGRREAALPVPFKRAVSMHPNFWDRQPAVPASTLLHPATNEPTQRSS
jgi:rhamnosyltransferase